MARLCLSCCTWRCIFPLSHPTTHNVTLFIGNHKERRTITESGCDVRRSPFFTVRVTGLVVVWSESGEKQSSGRTADWS